MFGIAMSVAFSGFEGETSFILVDNLEGEIFGRGLAVFCCWRGRGWWGGTRRDYAADCTKTNDG